MIIAIDGPAASGKSTTAKGVAQALGFDYLDTGALYRAITLAAVEAGIPPEEGAAMSEFLEALQLRYKFYKGKVRVLIEERDISEEIRSPEIASKVSAYSAVASVRAGMVELQRKFARGKNLVAEGRDMGSVVFPEAELKIFLKSDPRIRAERRAAEFRAQGKDGEADQVLKDLERRDNLDSGRDISPLIQTEDAVVLDNTHLSIPEQIEAVVKLAGERMPPPKIQPDDLLFKPEMQPEEYRVTFKVRPIYRFVWRLVWLLGKLLFGLKIHHGDRSPKEGGLLVACNHIAWLDPPMAGLSVKRELTFVAKRELFKNKLFGGFISYFNAVPIKRGSFDRTCFDTLGDRLRHGGTVFFFPEGTRKPLGRLGRAKWGLGLMAAESRCPVQPVFIKGSKHWKQTLIRRKRIHLYLGRPLHVQPLMDRGLEGRELYEVFGEGVMAEIARLQEEAGGPF